MAVTTKKPDHRFDPAVLEEMSEPLTVRVEKLRGGQARTPIELPPVSPELASGMGWDKDSVRRLEQFIMTECPGGGHGVYSVIVIDASQPPKRLEWQFFADPRLYPEIAPALPLYGTPVLSSQQQKPQQQQQVYSNMAQNPNWPTFPYTQAQQPGTAPVGAVPQQPPVQVPQPPPWPWGFPQPQVAATPIPSRRRDEDDRREEEARARQKELESRLQAAEERLKETERAKAEADYKAQLDRLQQEHARQVTAQQVAAQQSVDTLKEELRRISERVAKPAIDPELERERAERERLERQRDRELAEQRAASERQIAEQRAERERLERKMEMDAVNTRFEKMMEQMARIAEQSQAKPTGPDPVLLALQEQVKAQQEEARRERERYEAERREAERRETERREREALREEMRRQEQAFKEQILLMQQNSNRGPDPVIQMMQESTRQQIDALKEVLRTQQTSTDKLSAYMMSPRDILAIAKDNSSGIDQLTKNVVGVYNDMFQTQRQMIEMAAQLTGGGESPVTRIIEQGLGRASELAERYVKLKTAEATGAAKVQEAQINAQAHLYAQQQARMADMAAREAAAVAAAQRGGGLNGAGQRPIVTTPPVAPANGQAAAQGAAIRTPNNGAGSGALPHAPAPQASQQPPAPVEAASQATDQPAQSAGAKVIPLRRLGRTDEEWFGPALGYVHHVRNGVAELMTALSEDPPRVVDESGKPIGLQPHDTVDLLLRAVNYTLAQGQQILAIDKLFMEKRYAELMDILLPEVPQQYRDDCVKLLNEVKGPDDDDDDDDEDDEDGASNGVEAR